MNHWGRVLVALWLCAASTLAPVRAAEGYRVVDLMPQWWAFWSQAQTLDVDAQARMFRDTVARMNPDAYAPHVIGLRGEKPYDEEIVDRYKRVQARTGDRMELMRRLSTSIAHDLPVYESKFRETFPDLAYRGDIYFMHSLGGFDGAVRKVNGTSSLMFGIDMIAYVYGTDADPQPFFHHELFHVYQAQFEHPEDAQLDDAIIGGLWREGLATYVAQTLNPAARGVSIFGLPRTMPERAQAQLPRLARQMRALLASTSEDDYRRWFLGGDENAPVPPRSGYFIGFRVAARLAEKHSLQELAHASITQLRPEIEAALDELAATR